jgi:hypothetical protein
MVSSGSGGRCLGASLALGLVALLIMTVLFVPASEAMTHYDDPLTTSSVQIQSGTGSFLDVSGSNKVIYAQPGDTLSGDLSVQTINGMASSNRAPLIWTPSWGDHSSSFRTINDWISSGAASYSTDVSITIPSTTGTYYIIFAFNAEVTGAQVASCTSWRYEELFSELSWNDGNDVAGLSAQQIAQLNSAGRTTVTYQHADIQTDDSDGTHAFNQAGWSLPGDAIKIVVSNPGENISPFTESYLKVESGTGSFSYVSPSNKQITVEPGGTITGTVKMEAKNDLDAGTNAPLVGTPNWGGHSSSHWTVSTSISSGTNDYVTNEISLTAPGSDGTYYLIFAYGAENTAAQIASLTDKSYGGASWNDGEDLADISSAQVTEAQSLGRTSMNCLFDTGYQEWIMPVDVIKVVVDSLTHYDDPLMSSSVRVQSGTGSFSSVTSTNKQINVQPGGSIAGSLSMTTINGLEASDRAPLIGTTSWGSHSTSFWMINEGISSGTATYTATISQTVPNEPGTYYLIFAFNAEMNGAEVASSTNWRYVERNGGLLWNNGNDVAELSASQISDAQTNGRTHVSYTFQTWSQPWTVPADAVTVVVGTPPPSDGGDEVQNGNIVGLVRDPSGAPLSGVIVSLSNGGEMITLTNGSYYFELPAGSYVITFSKEGYQNQQVETTLVTNSTNQLDDLTMVMAQPTSPDPPLPPWVPIAFVLAAATALVAILVIRKVR